MRTAAAIFAAVLATTAVAAPAPAGGSRDAGVPVLAQRGGRSGVAFPLVRQEPNVPAGANKRDLMHVRANRVVSKYARFMSPEKLARAEHELARRTVPLTNWDHDLQYNVAINIGTPPQTFQVIADTGSPDLWVMSNTCNDTECAGSLLFDPSKSTSFKTENKNMSLAYGSGDLTGVYATDIVALDSSTYFPQEFGLADKLVLTHLRSRNTQGILGLSWPMKNRATPFWYNLMSGGNFDETVFGMYLRRSTLDSPADGNDTNGGELTIGGTDSTLYVGEFNTIPLKTENQVFWNIPLDSTTVNGVKIGQNGSTAIMDSGTSLIYTSSANAAAFYAPINGSELVEDYWQFPCASAINVSFSFGGIDYPVLPYDMVPLQMDNDICLGSVQPQLLPLDAEWLFGDSFLKNVYTKYQFYPPAVGFAPLSGNATVIVNSTAGMTGNGSSPTGSFTDSPASTAEIPLTTDTGAAPLTATLDVPSSTATSAGTAAVTGSSESSAAAATSA